MQKQKDRRESGYASSSSYIPNFGFWQVSRIPTWDSRDREILKSHLSYCDVRSPFCLSVQNPYESKSLSCKFWNPKSDSQRWFRMPAHAETVSADSPQNCLYQRFRTRSVYSAISSGAFKGTLFRVLSSLKSRLPALQVLQPYRLPIAALSLSKPLDQSLCLIIVPHIDKIGAAWSVRSRTLEIWIHPSKPSIYLSALMECGFHPANFIRFKLSDDSEMYPQHSGPGEFLPQMNRRWPSWSGQNSRMIENFFY